MRIYGINRIKHGFRRVRNKFFPKNIILLYHRITHTGIDPWSLCVTPNHFTEHLEVLQKLKVAVPLKQMAQSYQNDKMSHRAVALTFDDGYADNFYQAKPLLERFNIPATFFIPTGNLNQHHEFWWDELGKIFLQPGDLPDILSIKIRKREHKWKLGKSRSYNNDEFNCFCGWNATENTYPTFRHYLYSEFCKLLRPLFSNEKRKALDELSVWAGAETGVRAQYQTMFSDNIYTVGQSDLIDIGGHTVTHPFLSTIPIAMQEDEINMNKISLEEIIGQPITSFAYPHGDFSNDSVRIVRESGFSFACSTIGNMVFRNTDPFILPRIAAKNWNGDEFERKLRSLLHK